MYELEFTDNEIRIVLNALDFYSRIWIGCHTAGRLSLVEREESSEYR